MTVCARNVRRTVLIGAFLASGASALAAPGPGVRAPSVQALIDCRALTADAERLACFDKAVAAMTAAESSGDLVTIDREQRRAVRRQAFGLALPTLTLFDRGEKPEEVDRLSVVVSSAAQNTLGKWFIKLDDGALWRQTDDNELIKAPHKGSAAVITKGSLGSFFMSIDGQQAIKVHRDS